MTSRLFTFALAVLALSTSIAAAQAPPEPLPMGVPYIYQYGNQHQTNWVAWPNGWYRLVAYGPAPLYGYPSYYPFGATGHVYGRYSWDYTTYFSDGLGYYSESLPSFPYPMYQPASYYLQYPTLTYNWAWKGFTW